MLWTYDRCSEKIYGEGLDEMKLEHVQKILPQRGNVTKAIQDVSFPLRKGELLGIMGLSGSTPAQLHLHH